MIINVLTILYLAAASVLDIRRREVSVRMTLIYVSFVLADLMAVPADIKYRVWSVACGGMAAVISLISGEALGMGDAVVIAALGLAYPLRPLLVILSAASGACGLYCLALIIKKKGSVPEKGIPFIPFLLAGTLCLMAL